MQALFDSFLSFDLAVFQWIQSVQNPVLTPIFTLISAFGEKGVIFLFLGLMLLLKQKYRKIGVAVLGAVVLTALCNNLILKDLLARPRPFQLTPDWWTAVYRFPAFVRPPDSFSFPSGHTSSAFAAAFAVLFYRRKWGVPLLFFGALMGFSRVYLEVHYCTDVLFGAAFGVLYGLLAVLIVQVFYPKVYPVFEEKTKTIIGRVFPQKKDEIT